MDECHYNGEHYPEKNVTSIKCDKMSCKCLPNRALCGEPGSIDLTDWMTDKEEGPTGPATYICEELPGDNGNHTCKFQEPHMNDLISLISEEDYFSLACVSGECMHVTQVPGYTRPVPSSFFTPVVIFVMTALGLGLVGGVLLLLSWLQRKAEQQQFDVYTYATSPGVEVGEGDIPLTEDQIDERNRRALMSGHTPCSVMFRNVSYVIKAKKSGGGSALGSKVGALGDAVGRLFRGRNSSNDGAERAPLLTDGGGDGYESEATSEVGTVTPGRRRKIQVLNNVHGYVKPGQVMAIMGGSGAGKTTFLDILARKSKAGKVTGELLVNGKAMTDDEYRSIIGYVDQEDTLMDTLTVYETVMYSALLRLPRTMSYESKKRRVQETLMELDLLHVANRRIGSAGSRGISGGEKRRVSIACELVTSPSILFLDEPTSGLDSYNAYNVIETLVSLARNYQRTVIFTIHQPRSNIYALFDQLLLLAKGRMVYSGPAQALALEHFSSLGFECPRGFNIADYLVDLTMHAIDTDTTDPFPDPIHISDNADLESGPSSDSNPKRKHSIQIEQENKLFTPRPSSSTSVPQPPEPFGFNFANDGTSSSSDTPTPAASTSTPAVASSSSPSMSAEKAIPVPKVTPPLSATANTSASRSKPQLSQSLDNTSPAPLRNSIAKRRMKMGAGTGSGSGSVASLFSAEGEHVSGSVGAVGGSGGSNRHSWHAHTEASNGGVSTQPLSGGPAEDRRSSMDAAEEYAYALEAEGNHLRMLVEGYERSGVASLIQREIDLSKQAAQAAAGASTDSNHASDRTFSTNGGSRRLRSISSFASLAESALSTSSSSNSTTHSHTRRLASIKNRPTPLQQFKILSERTFKNLYRNPSLLRTHYVISVVVAGICGGLFWKMRNDIGGFQNRMGLFFFVCSLFGFGCLSSMHAFAGERLIFIKERANRYYQPITYYTSKILFDMLPLRVIPPIILGLICYHMTGLRSESPTYLLKFLLILVLFNLTASSCCLTLSLLFSESSVATLIATLFMLFQMLFGGLLLNRNSIPSWGAWLESLSFFNGALEALVVNEVNGLTLIEEKFGLKIDVPGAIILQTFGFNSKAYWFNVGKLCIMFFTFLSVGYVWLQWKVKERR
ncbi:hypothetical protein HDV05_007300 [Chytridiales sp. JEL 0842]|nr:hypothetical protein HDV05_007300 [Chytridiales sp. JEL 0842]